MGRGPYTFYYERGLFASPGRDRKVNKVVHFFECLNWVTLSFSLSVDVGSIQQLFLTVFPNTL